MTPLPLGDLAAARDRVAEFADAGATRIIHVERYADLAALGRTITALGRLR
jgi:hypothetical protein